MAFKAWGIGVCNHLGVGYTILHFSVQAQGDISAAVVAVH